MCIRDSLGAAELAALFTSIQKRPLRPTWLSSEGRTISTRPPVLTPAEIAAGNGQVPAMPPPGSATQVAPITEAIDQAAVAGASPYADDPVVGVGELPPDQTPNA